MRRVGFGMGALVAAWCAGFAWFAHTATRGAPPPPRADGIVALTGGSERVETALRLLEGGQAQIMLISGVGGMAAFPTLARRAGAPPSLGSRVTLGRAAASTRGNAAETALWARANGLHSLLVVTAGYHMARALTELSRAMPDVALWPVPVQPTAPVPLRLLAAEYTKLLAAEMGLSALLQPSSGRAGPS